MPWSPDASRETPLASHDHRELPAPGSCIFCNKDLELPSTGLDPMAFRAHLAASDVCRREYKLWRQVIRDEWLGD